MTNNIGQHVINGPKIGATQYKKIVKKEATFVLCWSDIVTKNYNIILSLIYRL